MKVMDLFPISAITSLEIGQHIDKHGNDKHGRRKDGNDIQ
jgi:hypothetical protein